MDDGSNPFEGGRFHYVKLGAEENQRQSVPPPQSGVRRPRNRRQLMVDRTLGILLGLVLGLGIVTAFVFLGSEDAIDAPRIQGSEQQTERQRAERP